VSDVKALFGQRLRAIRRRRKLTQESLGELAKLDYKHIWSIENGRNAPSFEAISRLAKALKVEPCEFFISEQYSADQLRRLIVEVDNIEPRALTRFFEDLVAALRRMQGGK
jgi:transcriptional regulator with XRE-family HTH domain